MSRALVVAATLLLTLPFASLVSAAEPVPPAPEGWSPYDTLARTHALAFARAGTTIAVALDTYNPATSGASCTLGVCPPGTSSQQFTVPDLAIVETSYGWARNGTGNTGGAQPLGRVAVAVTPDGRTVASIGYDRSGSSSPILDPSNPGLPGSPGNTCPGPACTWRLYVDRAPAGGNFSSASSTTMVATLADPSTANVRGLALSADGSRVVVLTDDGMSFNLTAYNVAGTQLAHAFHLSFRGAGNGLAGDATLNRVFVGGALFETATNQTRAALVSVDYASGAQAGQPYVEGANGTAVMTLSATPDGRLVALGTNTGRLSIVDLAAGRLAGAYQAASVSEPVGMVALSPEGTHLALSAAGRLATFRLAGGAPTPAWSTATAGHVNSLSYNATGAILVASINNGTASGVYAYGEESATPFWTEPGEVFDAKINDAGTQVAYRQSHIVKSERLTRGFALEYPNGAHVGPVRPLRAGAATIFDMVVRAPSSVPETVALATTSNPFLVATIDPAIVTVRPGEARHVNVTLAATPQFTGTQSVNLTATGLSTFGSDAATLSVSFEGVANITFLVNQTEFVVTPGQPTEATLAVVNNGTSDAAVGLSYSQHVSQGAPWGLTVDQTSFRLPQGSITPIRIVVTPPLDTLNGTNDAILFNLEGPNVSDSITLHFRVNPHLGVHLVSHGGVKFISPSTSAVFNVTVTNNGSIARQFTAFADQVPTSNKYWTVEVPQAPFRLDPGASRDLAIRVIAPGDISASDHTVITLRMRSVPEVANETFVEDNVTLFASYQAPPTPTASSTPSAIPFPALPLAIAAAALAAVVVRRRSS